MNKQYAIEILEMVERHVLNYRSSLAREAFSYLKKLKKTDTELKNRIYKQQYK